MLKRHECIERLREFQKESGQRLGITRLGIFGSVARQENDDDSDLDVVVELDRPTLRGMYEIEQSLSQLFKCKVDVVQMRPTLRPRLKHNINRDSIYV